MVFVEENGKIRVSRKRVFLSLFAIGRIPIRRHPISPMFRIIIVLYYNCIHILDLLTFGHSLQIIMFTILYHTLYKVDKNYSVSATLYNFTIIYINTFITFIYESFLAAEDPERNSSTNQNVLKSIHFLLLYYYGYYL